MTNTDAKKCPGGGMMCVENHPAQPGYYCPVCSTLVFTFFDGRDLPTVPYHDDERQVSSQGQRSL